MPRQPIHPDTTIGPVHLVVGDLDRSATFYRDRLGFSVREGAGRTAALGAGASTAGPDLLVLHERRDAPRPRGTTGLYHFAVLVPSRRELARSLEHLVHTRTSLTGASDHLVSEALYLNDPDGNGIEIYRDRPRAQWPFQNGEVRMAVDPLDLESLLRESRDGRAHLTGLVDGTTIGHIHLRVSDIGAAERFYADLLGFDIMARYGNSASFLSAGGYHHHIGLNTWTGVGAPPPPEGAIGLDHYVVNLPSLDERDRVASRAREGGVAVEAADDGLLLEDPSRNRILLAHAPRRVIGSASSSG